MSPDEAQLRAALRDGEGERPDADALISHAAGVRQARRRRLTAAASGVAVAAVVGLGVTGLAQLGGGRGGGAPSAGPSNERRFAAQQPAAGAVAGGASSAASSPASGAGATPSGSASRPGAGRAPAVAAALRCPATRLHLMLPGGGGSGQFGSGSPLFPGGVAALRVCFYPGTGGLGGSDVLTGATAVAVADTLEKAPATRTPTATSCPPQLQSASGAVELLGVSGDGTLRRPVMITMGCPAQATNGTAVRYLSSLPGVVVSVPPGGASGSQVSLPPASPPMVHVSPVR